MGRFPYRLLVVIVGNQKPTIIALTATTTRTIIAAWIWEYHKVFKYIAQQNSDGWRKEGRQEGKGRRTDKRRLSKFTKQNINQNNEGKSMLYLSRKSDFWKCCVNGNPLHSTPGWMPVMVPNQDRLQMEVIGSNAGMVLLWKPDVILIKYIVIFRKVLRDITEPEEPDGDWGEGYYLTFSYKDKTGKFMQVNRLNRKLGNNFSMETVYASFLPQKSAIEGWKLWWRKFRACDNRLFLKEKFRRKRILDRCQMPSLK